MRHEYFVLLLAVLVWNVVVAGEELPLLTRVRRIIGGEPAEVEQIPYLVHLRKNGVFHCGGSLLTSRCVLTAAHCFRGSKADDFVVRGGVTLLTEKFNKRMVERIFTPPTYNNYTFNHDIAIVRLSSPLEGYNLRQIAVADYSPKHGDFVQVSGWGLRQEEAEQPPNQMHTVRLRVMQQEKCRALYADYRNVTRSMFCASVPGLKDACTADSGGPAVINGRLVGVVSWGKRSECGRVDSPGVYVRLSQLRKWIMRTLYENC